MTDERSTHTSTDSEYDVSRRTLLRSLPLGLGLAPGLGRSTDVATFAEQRSASSLSGSLTDRDTGPDLGGSIRAAASECLMLDTRVAVRHDLFGRFGPVSGKLSIRDQLAGISADHCDLYTPVKLRNRRTGRCLNDGKGKHDDGGAQVTVASCADTPEQEWKLIRLSEGNVKLQNQKTGRCLTIDLEKHDHEGAPVTSASCADTPEQEWKLIRLSNGNVKLQNEGTGRCLNVHGGRHDHDGAPVTSFSCTETRDQEWELLYETTGRGDRIYDAAGSDDFFIRPVTSAEHAVDDVVRAFEAIDLGRRDGENFYSKNVGSADEGHMQGVARLPDGWLVQSYSKGFFLTHFPAKDDHGYEPWRTRPDRVETIFPDDLPDENRKHVGGVHAYGDLIAVPSRGGGEYRVEIYQLDPHPGDRPKTWVHRKDVIDISEYQNAAHYASILPLGSDDWLLAVGHDSRRRWKPHRVYFYVVPHFDGRTREPRYLGYWGRGKTVEDFQSLSLVAGSGGRVFLIGTGVQYAQANAHAKLYEVLSFSRAGGGRPEPRVKKLRERSPRSERHDCNLNAGATFFPTAEGGLAMYCTEKKISEGSITTREFYNEEE